MEIDDLPEQIISTILARAEGNPFYIEEFVRMLIEKDVLKPSGGKWRVASTMELRTVDVPTSLGGLDAHAFRSAAQGTAAGSA